ncbi:hypothetical protein LguiB_013546 [Lonicera macranthoides]
MPSTSSPSSSTSSSPPSSTISRVYSYKLGIFASTRFRLDSSAILRGIDPLKRDTDERKINGCSLMVSQSDGAIPIEDVRAEVLRMIESSRRELMRMMLIELSVLPKTLIESFFYLHQISYYLYKKSDEYRILTERTVDDMNGLLYEPLDLLPSNLLEESISASDSIS